MGQGIWTKIPRQIITYNKCTDTVVCVSDDVQ